MRRALVVGKFAPFHRGHGLLVSTAEAVADEVVVAVYETAWYEVPAATRAGWIRALHPATQVELVPDLPPGSFDERTEAAAHAAHVRLLLGEFTDVFTSEAYGDSFADALGARHTSVDPGRRRFPVSGTAVRRDPERHRDLVHPLVQDSLVRRVVFLGAESTGKTTLARELATRLDTEWVPEYGRELWEERRGRLALEDMTAIVSEQLRREREALPRAAGFLFCDTNAVTTELWSRRLFGCAPPEVVRVAAANAARYETFLCEPDFPFVDDGTRESAAAQAAFQAAVRADLDRRGLPYVALRGTVEERAAAVDAALKRGGRSAR